MKMQSIKTDVYLSYRKELSGYYTEAGLSNQMLCAQLE